MPATLNPRWVNHRITETFMVPDLDREESAAPQPYSLGSLKQPGQGYVSHSDDDSRAGAFDVPLDKAPTAFGLLNHRVAIVGWATADGVVDPDFNVPGDFGSEQIAGLANKGLAVAVLCLTWGLSQDVNIRAAGPIGDHLGTD
jgi:hypothetical protein